MPFRALVSCAYASVLTPDEAKAPRLRHHSRPALPGRSAPVAAPGQSRRTGREPRRRAANRAGRRVRELCARRPDSSWFASPT